MSIFYTYEPDRAVSYLRTLSLLTQQTVLFCLQR
jgi:hypothetical protein